jgi:IS30 family transposase
MGWLITSGAPRCHVRNQRPSANLKSAARGAPGSWVDIPSKRQDARRPQPRPVPPGGFSLTEGDLILGSANRTAIGTLVERTTGFLVLLHLPEDHGAVAVQEAIIAAVADLPDLLRKTLTWDQGIEMANHTTIAKATGLDIYFCDPAKPWQRASNENTNGLLRQYFPKGTDLSFHGPGILEHVAIEMNSRPRKRLNWRTPAEALDKLLSEHDNQPGVAHAG